jgi:tRNA/rRNA methyltransferase
VVNLFQRASIVIRTRSVDPIPEGVQVNTIDNVRVLLVRPKSARNVGAVCRAMKNMGVRDLAVVRAAGLDLQEARRVAIHAADLLSAARFCESLEEAVRDCSLVAGVTRRRGRFRKYFSLLPEELAQRIGASRRGRVGIVFGNEEAGLTDEELECCDLAVRIPSSSLFPSLNLSHAVQIIVYEIFRKSQESVIRRYTPVPRETLNSLVDVMLGSLHNIGFFKQVGSREMGVFFRDILSRACLSGREAKRVEKVFRKISGLCAGRGI